MALSRKRFIGLLGTGAGILAAPSALHAYAPSALDTYTPSPLEPLRQDRKTRISYRYFLPCAPAWGDRPFATRRLEELVSFGREAGIDGFQFFVNTPWSSYYLLPVDADCQQEWVDWMKEVVAPRIRKEGF